MIEHHMYGGQTIETISTPYPYADKNTFEFLQTVVRDGTQNTLPRYMNEERWVRDKNITGIYFSCNITEGELADMYGVTRQRIDQIISKTLLRFWENSIGYDQMKFPIDSLSTENPASKHRIHGFSGVDQIRFESLISSGFDDEEVAKRFGTRLDLVRQTMRRMGKREQITSRREEIKRSVKQLETIPVENYAERQKVIDSLLSPISQPVEKIFVSLRTVAADLGLSVSANRFSNADVLVNRLKDMGVPVGIASRVRDGKTKRYILIHRKDFEHLKNIGQSTNPSETPSSAV